MKLKLSSARVAAVVAVAAAGAIGLGALTVPAMADDPPPLPPVSPEDLVASVLTAHSPAFGGTVEVDNALGLPTLPGMGGPEGDSPLTQPVTTVRAWSDGQGRGRLVLPSRNGEQVFVSDGTSLWRYDSATRTATEWRNGPRPAAPHPRAADPAQAARAVVDAVRTSSNVAVEGTDTVAGRPVYELVLTPAPTERTLLREVRVAVDEATRVPLRLTVLADGSTDPALRVGFTDLDVGPQDPGLFCFTPPEGVRVEQPRHDGGPGPRGHHGPGERPHHRHAPGAPDAPDAPGAAERPVRTVGEGWDTLVVGTLPPAALEGGHQQRGPRQRGERDERRGEQRADPRAVLEQIGEPVSGPWGDGWVVRTAVGTVLVASDGRFAAGAVPQQVLAEALTR